mmetsp:Transcript_25805/g.40392  ORF Transcript_25805/g.40392 Transcript_25805/m.40392 type:complete len:331 (+) Transcript_25805:564-1556(+)
MHHSVKLSVLWSSILPGCDYANNRLVVQDIMCGNCDLYLGMKVAKIEPKHLNPWVPSPETAPALESSSATESIELQRSEESASMAEEAGEPEADALPEQEAEVSDDSDDGTDAGAPLPWVDHDTLHPSASLIDMQLLLCRVEQATSEDLFGDGVQVLPTVRQGEGLICEAYTRVLTRCGSVHNDSTKLCCANCESFICPMHAVLSDQHCWRLPGRDCVESAYYVNSLIPESFTLTKQRSSRLAQGDMTVADVSCSSCNCPLGWKFVSDCHKRNRHQVGRFGLVMSALTEIKTNDSNTGSKAMYSPFSFSTGIGGSTLSLVKDLMESENQT